MPIVDLKVKPEILSPKPPSIASDEEFAAGTSTTASPTVKQAKEKLVTTDTTQTIAGQKAFTTQLLKKSKFIDITTQPEKYMANNGFQFVDKNGNIMGYLENSQMAGGSIKTGIHARNKDGYQTDIGVYAPLSGTTGAYATAPNTPDNAPANAIVTKDKIANMVTTNTAQTISGSKRFTQPAEGMSIELTADTDQQTIPTTAALRQLGIYCNATHTKGDGYTCWLQGLRGSDGWTATEIYARRFLESDSQEIINYLRVNITPEGIPVSYTKTPPVGVTGEEIVTAGWFNSKMQVVSALPANPDPNVFYFIPG